MMTATTHNRSEHDERIDRIAAEAEAHKDDPIPAGARVTRGHDRTRVLQVRLNADELSNLTDLAVAADLPVSTLARQILLDAMDEAMTSAARELLRRHPMPDDLPLHASQSRRMRETIIRLLLDRSDA